MSTIEGLGISSSAALQIRNIIHTAVLDSPLTAGEVSPLEQPEITDAWRVKLKLAADSAVAKRVQGKKRNRIVQLAPDLTVEIVAEAARGVSEVVKPGKRLTLREIAQGKICAATTMLLSLVELWATELDKEHVTTVMVLLLLAILRRVIPADARLIF